ESGCQSISEVKMKRRPITYGILGVVIAVALLLVYYFYLGSSVPTGQQPLARLDSSNIESFTQSFNQSNDSLPPLAILPSTSTVCLQGASAFQKLPDEQCEGKIRVFVIWEPVLPTDLAAPSTMPLQRLNDSLASQYYAKDHLVSKSNGEEDLVWDYVAGDP